TRKTSSSSSKMLPSIVPRIQQKVLEQQIVANSPKLTAMVSHPAGPFTVHFWAPTIKWAISLANVADMRRSPETISVAQQTAVTGTGVIWSRYSMVITPKNWNLFAVNVFMAGTGLVQFYRKFTYDPEKVEEAAKSS
ncbi:Mitochondrial pyruvate carriers domain-containing protein, partial [Phytophthora infestans]